MHTLDKPSIGLATRQQLSQLMADRDIDEGSARLVNAALEKARVKSYCAWAARLAAALGASHDLALAAGSFAEMQYAAIDVIDDVEDGDAGAYLRDVPLPVQINLSNHLAVLAVLGAARLAKLCRERYASTLAGSPAGAAPDDFVEHVTRLFSRAGCGQRLEITREAWSIDAYVHMTNLVGGCQLEIYVRAAALAAAVDAEPLVRPTAPLALLFQMACDDKSHDPRLVELPSADIRAAQDRAVAALDDALDALPVAAQPLFLELSETVRRPPSLQCSCSAP